MAVYLFLPGQPLITIQLHMIYATCQIPGLTELKAPDVYLQDSQHSQHTQQCHEFTIFITFNRHNELNCKSDIFHFTSRQVDFFVYKTTLQCNITFFYKTENKNTLMLDYNNCILSAADVFLQRRDSPILYSLIY